MLGQGVVVAVNGCVSVVTVKVWLVSHYYRILELSLMFMNIYRHLWNRWERPRILGRSKVCQ